LKPGHVACADGTVGWDGSANVASLPGRRAPLQPWDLGEIEDFYPGTYRFWYLRRDGWLLSMQPLGFASGVPTPPVRNGMQTSLADVLTSANGFLPDALEANRAGRLSERQVRTLGRAEKAVHWQAPMISIGLIAAAPAFWFYGYLQSALVCGGIGIATFVKLLRQPALSRMDRDLADGRVLVIEGEIHKVYARKFSAASLLMGSERPYSEGYNYAIGSEQFPVSEKAYHALVDGVACRLYYLPRSKRVVNIEPCAPIPR
jgi:hypothetical protein